MLNFADLKCDTKRFPELNETTVTISCERPETILAVSFITQFISLTNIRQMIYTTLGNILTSTIDEDPGGTACAHFNEMVSLLPVTFNSGGDLKTAIYTKWRPRMIDGKIPYPMLFPLAELECDRGKLALALCPTNFQPAINFDYKLKELRFGPYRPVYALSAMKFWPLFEEVAEPQQYQNNCGDACPLYCIKQAVAGEKKITTLVFAGTVDYELFREHQLPAFVRLLKAIRMHTGANVIRNQLESLINCAKYQPCFDLYRALLVMAGEEVFEDRLCNVFHAIMGKV